MTNARGYGKASTEMHMADSAAADAFGRLRTSEGTTIFDSKPLYDSGPLYWDDQEVSGAGTQTEFLVDLHRVRIGVSNTTVGKRTRQTFMRFNCQSGTGQLVQAWGIFGTDPTGIIKEIGAFDNNDGYFFRREDGITSVVIRTSVSGSPVDTAIPQDQWNIDKMDGSGVDQSSPIHEGNPSSIEIDWNFIQIFVIDFQWPGRVRFGLIVRGVIWYIHELFYENDEESIPIATPNLPARYSVENDGSGPASDLFHICTTVISEGQTPGIGTVCFLSTEGVPLGADDALTNYAVIGIRLKAANIGATIEPLSVDVLETFGGKSYLWTLVMNPTIAGTFSYSDLPNSSVQVATGITANEVTGGVVVGGGHGASAQKGSTAEGDINSSLRLGAAIDGTVDELVLCVMPVTGTQNAVIHGSLTWRELL